MIAAGFLAAALALDPQRGGPLPFDECADGAQQIAAALSTARAENRRVLVVWGANWCSWCRALHALLRTEEALRQEILYEYEVVSVDVGHFDKHLDLMLRYGLDPRRTSIPYLTFLDADGQVVANQQTNPLELKERGRKAHDPEKVLEVLVQHRALYPEARDLLALALQGAAASDQRVLVHFAAPWCAWCHAFETWLGSPEVRPILEKDLVLRKIDVDRTMGGAELLGRFDPGGKGGIPWFAILDAQGNALATSAGPDGRSIGNPRTPEQIDHFASMLTRACKRLSAEDVETLRRSLAARALEETAKVRARAGGG